MTKRVPFLISAVLFALAFAWLPGAPPNQSAYAVVGAAGTPAQEGRPAMPGMQMGMQVPEMMKMQDKMTADMKASQGKMDELVKKMNAASGDAKVNAMAELLTELVREHKVMSEGFGSVDRQMMGKMK